MEYISQENDLVRRILNLEGAEVFGAIIYVYFFQVDGGWILFAALLLAPDVGLIAYASGSNRLGAILYDAFHTYVLSVALLVSGVAAGSEVVVQVGLISAAHIGMDRALGYGLKYAAGPKPTHLQQV
jgi:hypothetical protein